MAARERYGRKGVSVPQQISISDFTCEQNGEEGTGSTTGGKRRTGGMHRSIAPTPRDGVAAPVAAEQVPPPPSSPSCSDDGRGRTPLRGTGTILSRLDAAADSVVVVVLVAPRRGDLELLGSSVAAVVVAAVRAAVVRGLSTLTCFFWPGVRSDPPLKTAAAAVVVRLAPMMDPS